MIKYHMYRNYWLLTALGRYRAGLSAAASEASLVGAASGASQCH